MVEIPKSREDALDIVWGCLRNINERWMGIYPDTKGAQVREIAQKLGWSYSTVNRLMHVLLERGQVTRTWNHKHQTYWSGHYKTIGELPRGGNEIDPDISDIPF